MVYLRAATSFKWRGYADAAAVALERSDRELASRAQRLAPRRLVALALYHLAEPAPAPDVLVEMAALPDRTDRDAGGNRGKRALAGTAERSGGPSMTDGRTTVLVLGGTWPELIDAMFEDATTRYPTRVMAPTVR